MGALDGFRMLSLQNMPPVGSAGYVLAEMGMDVIQIEAPSPKRHLGGRGEGPDARDTAYDILGRNKRSVVVDLKSEAGRAAFFELAKASDVILEGFRPGAAARLGIGYDDVREHAPSIVYCSLSGFGQTGPYADIPMHDTESCAASGALTQNVDAEGRPVAYGVLLGDTGGGLHAAAAILAALLHRERTGVGQHLDVSMTASLLTFQLGVFGRALQHGEVTRPWPLDLGVFRCADGKYLSAANTGAHLWRLFCDAVELPELVDVVPGGPQWQAALAAIGERLATKTRDEWFEILHAAGASVAPALDLLEVADDPQALHSGAMVDLEHAELGTLRQPGFPVRFSETPVAFRKFASSPGADTEQVFEELGIDAAVALGQPA